MSKIIVTANLLTLSPQQKHSEASPAPNSLPPQPAQHQSPPVQPPPQPQRNPQPNPQPPPPSTPSTSFVPAYHFLARMLQSLQVRNI